MSFNSLYFEVTNFHIFMFSLIIRIDLPEQYVYSQSTVYHQVCYNTALSEIN
jgi:hypothetical protein